MQYCFVNFAAVNGRLLPTLIQYLEKRDETEDSLRIPVAVGIVQIAKHLPKEQRDTQIGKLLTVLSQVLRSKSQETRDLARETLCKIACSLGPAYLPLMIREMRAALLRGPHLHVLAYSVHALLVHVTTGDHAATFDKLDDCVADVAATDFVCGGDCDCAAGFGTEGALFLDYYYYAVACGSCVRWWCVWWDWFGREGKGALYRFWLLVSSLLL